jgi:excisionase family DNA binding protein
MKKILKTRGELLIDGGNLLSVDEVAAVLNVSKPSVYAWAKRGILPGIALGPQCLRFKPEVVRAWLEQKEAG